jgi:type I restriction enzyme S subunit
MEKLKRKTRVEQGRNNPSIRFPEFKDGWASNTIGDLFELDARPINKPSSSYKSIGIRSHFKGTFQRLDSDPSKNVMDTLYVVKENDLIVNITFAWEGAVAIASKDDEGGLVSHRFPTYINNKYKVEINFFRFLFPTNDFKRTLDLISPGSAGRNRVLKKSDFLKIKFFIPTLPEQKRIASFFTVLDKKIAELKQKKALLEQYKKGVMQKLFSQELRFKDENGKEFPKWEKKTLGNIGVTYNGLTGKTKDNFGVGKPYIQYKQIFDNTKIDVSKFDFVQVDEKESQNKTKYGDVFFTTSSETPLEIGYSSVLLENVDELYLNSFCFGYRINSFKELSPTFAQYLFRSPIFRKEVIKLGQGSTRYNMSKVELMKIEILLPSEKEQNKISTFLETIDEKLIRTTTQLQQTQQWKKGLLQNMFV